MTSTPLPKSSASPLAVLVVDDVEANLVAMAALLESTGAELVLVRSGEEALRQLLRRQFAVMLLDVQMPGMDGYEVARRLRAEFPEQPALLVALTGWGRTEDVERARDAGFDEHLVKPVDIVALRRLLSRAGDGRDATGD